MPNARDMWDAFMNGIIVPTKRDEVRATFEQAGLRVNGGGGAVDARPHHFIVIGADGPEDQCCFSFAMVPTDAIDDDMRQALDLCDSEEIDASTADANPELWEAWCRIALATGTHTADELATNEPVPLEEETVAALTKCWDAYAFSGWGGEVDGARLDRTIAGATLVFDG
jgi:hypothetical protein